MSDYSRDSDNFSSTASFVDDMGKVIYKSHDRTVFIARPYTYDELRYPEIHRLHFNRDISFVQIVNTTMVSDGKHWIVIAYDIKEEKLKIYDSDYKYQLLQNGRYKLAPDIEALIVHLLKPKNDKIEIHLIECPQQKLWGPCGLYAASFMIFLALQKAITPDCLRMMNYATLKDSLQKVIKGHSSLMSFHDKHYNNEKKDEKRIDLISIDYHCKKCSQLHHPADTATGGVLSENQHCEKPETAMELTDATEYPFQAIAIDEDQAETRVLSYDETYKCCGVCGHFYHPRCGKLVEYIYIFRFFCHRCDEIDNLTRKQKEITKLSEPKFKMQESHSATQMEMSDQCLGNQSNGWIW